MPQNRAVACQAQTVWCFVVVAVVVSEKDRRILDDCDKGGVNSKQRLTRNCDRIRPAMPE